MSADPRSNATPGPQELLGTVRVKAENGQVGDRFKIAYRLYPLRLLTVKLASYRGDTEQRVQQVQKLFRFDKTVPEGG